MPAGAVEETRGRPWTAAAVAALGVLFAFPLAEFHDFPFGPGPDGYLLFPFRPATDAGLFTLIGLAKVGLGWATLHLARTDPRAATRRTLLVVGWLVVAWGVLGLLAAALMGCLVGPAVPWTCPVGN